MRRLVYPLVLCFFLVQITAWGQNSNKGPEGKEKSRCPLAESLEGFARHLTLQVELYNLEASDGSQPDPVLKEKLEQVCLSQLDLFESLIRSRPLSVLLGVDYRSVSGRAEQDSMVKILSALDSLRRGDDPFAKVGFIKESNSGRITLASADIQSAIQTVRECRQQFEKLKAQFAPQKSTGE